MRKLFIGTILVSLLGALVIGTVLAWTGSTPAKKYYTATGTVCATISGEHYTGNQVYPTGSPVGVLRGGFANCTTSPGINLSLYDANPGDVAINSPGGCSLSGDVAMLSDEWVAPGYTTTADRWEAQITMGTGAGDGCQGQTIDYDVTINVET
jgi:hypothetical protein